MVGAGVVVVILVSTLVLSWVVFDSIVVLPSVRVVSETSVVLVTDRVVSDIGSVLVEVVEDFGVVLGDLGVLEVVVVEAEERLFLLTTIIK